MARLTDTFAESLFDTVSSINNIMDRFDKYIQETFTSTEQDSSNTQVLPEETKTDTQTSSKEDKENLAVSALKDSTVPLGLLSTATLILAKTGFNSEGQDKWSLLFLAVATQGLGGILYFTNYLARAEQEEIIVAKLETLDDGKFKNSNEVSQIKVPVTPQERHVTKLENQQGNTSGKTSLENFIEL